MSLRLILNYGRSHNIDPSGGDGRPRGGIVTALLALAQALAARGHEVHVFGSMATSSQEGGVHFHDRSTLAAVVGTHPPDVLILVPEVLPLLMPIPARARIVWSGNAHKWGDCALSAPWDWAPELGDRGRRARLYPIGLLQPYVDRMIMKSRWQAGYVAETQAIPADKLAVVFNGVPLHLYESPPPARHDRRLIYTSQARRGLDVLLKLFGDVRAAVPGTELHVFGYEYQRRGGAEGAGFPGQPGVVWRGSVGKAELARELRSATLMAYPCTFKETFCTSVAEAQAAGLPVVTSDRAALSERVSDGEDGFLISGRADEPGFQEHFAQSVVRLLVDAPLRRRFGEAAAAKAFRDYDWARIADHWEAQLEGLSTREVHLPAIDPSLDLLDPSLLRVEEQGASALVPTDLAHRWLRAEWASYGFDPSEVPGCHWAG